MAPRRTTTAIAIAVFLALAGALHATPAAGQVPDAKGARAVEVRVVEHDEFRWGDAAIGALAGFGLAAVCAGVLVAIDRKRRPLS